MPLILPAPFTRFLVNGAVYTGSFEEFHETDYAVSRGGEPDPSWSFVDSSGHFHAFDTKTGALPTLVSRSEHVPCNGGCGEGCEGYDAPRWSCSICGQDVSPGYRTVARQVPVADHQWWEAEIRGPLISPGIKVSVLIEQDGQPTRFGVAVVRTVTYDSGSAEAELLGDGVLGWRPLEQRGKTG